MIYKIIYIIIALLQEMNTLLSTGANVPQGIIMIIAFSYDGLFCLHTHDTAQGASGIRSRSCSTKVTLTVYNGRSDYIQLWWINYSGNYVYYGCIQPGTRRKQRAYGTHPFVLASNSGRIITTIIMGRRNVRLNIG